MRPANVLHLYRVRLRARLVQECFAVVGIAAGVALLFASQVSSSSLQSSVAQLSRGIAGNATLQLRGARSARLLRRARCARVRQIPGVRVAAPLLEASANAIGPPRQRVGRARRRRLEPVRARRRRSCVTRLSRRSGISARSCCPLRCRAAIGVTKFGQEVSFQLDGHTAEAPLYTQLHAQQIGPLIASPVALAPLSFAQEMTGLPRSREPHPRAARAPARKLGCGQRWRALAAGRLNVERVGYEEKLFAKAAAASNQSTELFAAISALVGFLFAFNAMLFTVPQRRRLIVDLRRDGYTPRTVIAVLLLDALVLGLVACVLGLALGEELSIHLLHSNPAFLSLAFTVGSQRVVSWQSVAIATGGGMLAAIVAVLSPLRDILSRDPLAASVSCGIPAGDRRGPGGGPCEGSRVPSPRRTPPRSRAWSASAAATRDPARRAGRGDPGNGACSWARCCWSCRSRSRRRSRSSNALARMFTSAVPHIAAMELSAARARAVAIAATGAVAVFGSVAIRGRARRSAQRPRQRAHVK